MPAETPNPRVGLVLGSGSARGWAHIGVIRGLEEAGIRPDIVCGTSIGALVGGAYASGDLDKLEAFVRELTWQSMIGFFDLSLSGGLIKGDKLIDFFRNQIADRPISELTVPFAAVATDLHTGREIWLREGSLLEAVRASIALPGLFTPVLRDGVVLVDGGLVDPVPVSLARAMGADVVIAVDLNSDMMGRSQGRRPKKTAQPAGAAGSGLSAVLMAKWRQWLGRPEDAEEDEKVPSLIDVIAHSLTIMSVRISRSRLAGEPADAMILPRLGPLGLLDYYRAEEAMAEGRKAVQRALPALHAALS